MTSWLGKFRTFLPQAIHGPVAVLYDRVATPGLRQFHRKVALEVASSLKSGSVLDVGTGPGHLLVEIARQNPDLELTGCDLSRKMLKIAKQSIEPVATVCVDPAWHDPAGGIRECLRVTAPGGRCWIYDLRTDVPAGTHAKLITGNWLGRLVLSWIFRFHGIDPRQYQTPAVVSWLGHGAMVQAQVHAAYLKLNIEKPDDRPHDGTTCSKSLSSVSSAALPDKE